MDFEKKILHYRNKQKNVDIQKSKKINVKNWMFPLIAILLIVIVLQFLYSRRQTDFMELYPQNGVLDVTEIDFSDRIFQVVNRWDYYPNKLYNAKDFAAGVEEKPVLAGKNISTDDVPFGTYRLRLKAKPHQLLTFCGFSLDYGTKVFVNGTEALRYGYVAEQPEKSVPAGGYMTIPISADENGEAEIIYQYSNFVHKEGGAIPATYLSTPQNIEEYKSSNALVSVGISGAMLILALYFLLSSSFQQQRSYLALAFCCLLMALRDNLFWGTYLLPPSASWEFTYRISLAVATLLPVSFLLLLRSLYPVGKRWVKWIYLGSVTVDVFLLLLLDIKLCTLFCRISYYLALPYFAYLVFGMCHTFYKKKFSVRIPDVLALGGLSIFLIALLWEALLSGHSSFATRFGLTPTGMLICILLIAISISLRIQEQKAALAESRSRGEMLERMNALNLDFLQKVAHELKTPLTVISGYAQLAGLQIAGNHLSSETPENLKIIQHEAMRLADLVTNLMEYSRGRQSEATFGTVEIAPLLDRIQAICTPMCLKNNNRIVITGQDCMNVYGNQEMLLQIFINLIVNANRHTKDGTVTISASDAESYEYVVFRVKDTGNGIAEEVTPYLFEKGFSKDGSSGLGLSVCKEAVEAHGGRIELEKTDSDGTTFAFTVLKRRLKS